MFNSVPTNQVLVLVAFIAIVVIMVVVKVIAWIQYRKDLKRMHGERMLEGLNELTEQLRQVWIAKAIMTALKVVNKKDPTPEMVEAFLESLTDSQVVFKIKGEDEILKGPRN